MKKSILFICLIISALHLSAQQETLFNKARVIGAFGSPITEIGVGNNNDLGNAYGGGAGLLINSFFIGGYGLANTNIEKILDDEVEVLDLAHGGLWLGYSYRPYKLIHPYASVRVGWGTVELDVDQDNFSRHDLDAITVITPEIGIELNVTKFFHIAAGAGYRWVDGVNSNEIYSNKNFSGLNAAISFKFGWFGSWKKKGE